MLLCPCSSLWLRTGPGFPMKFPKKPWCDSPWNGEPKPILNAYSTQMIRARSKRPRTTSIMLLIDQRFCITPP